MNNSFFNKEDSLSDRTNRYEELNNNIIYHNDLKETFDKINNNYINLKIENVSLNARYKEIIEENKKLVDKNDKLNKFIKEIKNLYKDLTL